jgi:hypothetical protein
MIDNPGYDVAAATEAAEKYLEEIPEKLKQALLNARAVALKGK